MVNCDEQVRLRRHEVARRACRCVVGLECRCSAPQPAPSTLRVRHGASKAARMRLRGHNGQQQRALLELDATDILYERTSSATRTRSNIGCVTSRRRRPRPAAAECPRRRALKYLQLIQALAGVPQGPRRADKLAKPGDAVIEAVRSTFERAACTCTRCRGYGRIISTFCSATSTTRSGRRGRPSTARSARSPSPSTTGSGSSTSSSQRRALSRRRPSASTSAICRTSRTVSKLY